MKKKTYTYIVLTLLTTVLSVSCTKDDAATAGQEPLSLDVSIDQVSRAATVYNTENTTAFSNDATIGVTAKKYDTENTAYNSGAVNVPYSTNGTSWSSESPILLTIDKAQVSAYYPYASTINPAAINVNGADNVDYMYAPWTSTDVNILYTSPKVSLTMKHAQSIIRVTLQSKTNESPQPNLSKVHIEGTNYGRTGKLNSFTGEFSNIGSENIIENYTPNRPLSTTAITDQWFVVTNGTTADITITLTIDSEEYTATWSNITFEQGKIYNFPLTFGTALLKPSPVTIEPWTAGTVNDPSTDIHRQHPDEVGVWLGTYNNAGKKIYWATHNLNAGVTKGTTYSAQGDYYQWGQYYPRYPQFTTLEKTTDYAPFTEGCLISEEIDDNHTRYAFINSPTSFTNLAISEWRIPSYDEVNALLSNSDITWTTEATGIRATYTPTQQSVFFGYSGYLSATGMMFPDAAACFWTYTKYTVNNAKRAWYAWFTATNHMLTTGEQYYAMPIRPIRYEE